MYVVVNGLFSDINVSQGSVATYAKSGGIFSNNLLHIYQGIFQWKFVSKSVLIGQNYGQESVAHFLSHPDHKRTFSTLSQTFLMSYTLDETEKFFKSWKGKTCCLKVSSSNFASWTRWQWAIERASQRVNWPAHRRVVLGPTSTRDERTSRPHGHHPDVDEPPLRRTETRHQLQQSLTTRDGTNRRRVADCQGHVRRVKITGAVSRSRVLSRLRALCQGHMCRVKVTGAVSWSRMLCQGHGRRVKVTTAVSRSRVCRVKVTGAVSRSRALPRYSSVPTTADSYSWTAPPTSSIMGALSFTSTTSTLTLTCRDLLDSILSLLWNTSWSCLTSYNLIFNDVRSWTTLNSAGPWPWLVVSRAERTGRVSERCSPLCWLLLLRRPRRAVLCRVVVRAALMS